MKEFLKELKKSRTLLLMLAPAVIIIFIFAYLPMGGMVLAFKQYNYRDGIWEVHGLQEFLTISDSFLCREKHLQ